MCHSIKIYIMTHYVQVLYESLSKDMYAVLHSIKAFHEACATGYREACE